MGPGEDFWSLDYRVIDGDPEMACRMGRARQGSSPRPRSAADGRELEVQATAVDSGGADTQAVYRHTSARERKRVYAVKGVAGQAKPIWPKLASKLARRTSARSTCSRQFGVDTAKDDHASRLRLAEPGPGYRHSPKSRELSYFEQSTYRDGGGRNRLEGLPLRAWEECS